MTSRHAQSELRVGLFVLTFLALLAGSMVYIGIQKDLFAERFNFRVISTTGENVERGVPLVLSGFRVGQVADVDLTQVGKVVIEVEMLEKYHDWLRTDSQIILVQGGFIGKTYLQLVPGTQDAGILEDGASVDLNRVGGLDDIIAEARPVIEDLKSIVANVREITESVLDEKGAVQRTLANLEGISNDLRSPGGLVGYVTRDPRPVEKLESLLAHTDTAMARIATLVQSADARVQDLEPIQKEATALVGEVRGFVQEMKAFREDLRPAVDNAVVITEDIKKATRDLDRLRSRTEYTIRQGAQLIERMERVWPLSGGGAPAPPQNHPLP